MQLMSYKEQLITVYSCADLQSSDEQTLKVNGKKMSLNLSSSSTSSASTTAVSHWSVIVIHHLRVWWFTTYGNTSMQLNCQSQECLILNWTLYKTKRGRRLIFITPLKFKWSCAQAIAIHRNCIITRFTATVQGQCYFVNCYQYNT